MRSSRVRLERTIHIGQIIRVMAIFVFANKVKRKFFLLCLISPDLLSVFCTKTNVSDKGSIDISYTFWLLYFVKKMWKYPCDIKVSENCIGPKSKTVVKQDPDVSKETSL